MGIEHTTLYIRVTPTVPLKTLVLDVNDFTKQLVPFYKVFKVFILFLRVVDEVASPSGKPVLNFKTFKKQVKHKTVKIVVLLSFFFVDFCHNIVNIAFALHQKYLSNNKKFDPASC